MTSRRCDAIDERVEAEITRLHKEHPHLGHEGLMAALEQQGIHLDEAEFKRYIRRHDLAPGVMKQSWGWVASGRIWGIGPSSPPENRWYRRLFRRKPHD